MSTTVNIQVSEPNHQVQQLKYNHFLTLTFDKFNACDNVDPSVNFEFTTHDMIKLCDMMSHSLELEYNGDKEHEKNINVDTLVKISCVPLKRAELGIDCQINGTSCGKHIKFPYYTSIVFNDDTLTQWKSLETPSVLWISSLSNLVFQFESYSQLSKKYHWRLEQIQMFAKHFISVIQSKSESSTLADIKND